MSSTFERKICAVGRNGSGMGRCGLGFIGFSCACVLRRPFYNPSSLVSRRTLMKGKRISPSLIFVESEGKTVAADITGHDTGDYKSSK